MLKRSLLSFAVTASMVGLAGCDISSTTGNAGTVPEVQSQNQAAAANKVYPLFNPARSVLPVGIDLLFAGTVDGTADVGNEQGNPVKKALNDLDGISTLAPIDVQFSNPIDPASAVGGSTVFLVKLPNAASVGGSTNLILPDGIDATSVKALSLATIAPFFATTKADGTPADDSAFAAGTGLPESVAALNLFGANDGIPFGSPSPAPTQTDGILAVQPKAGVDYEVSVIGLDGKENNTIRISPLKPLDSQTKYIVFVTGSVKDPSGKKVSASPDYASISGTGDLVSSALSAVRTLLDTLEALGGQIITSGGSNLAPLADGIVYSAPFTTTDPTAVLGAMTAPKAALPAALNPSDAVSNAIEPQARDFEYIPQNQISISTLTSTAIPFDVNISQGAISLPQYVDAFSTDANDIWEALDTAATPTDTDGTANVTYNFPFAKEKRNVVVPVLMFEPIGSGSSGSCTAGKPWPVVILQHGFQGSRTSNLINGSRIANDSCHAVIAIDLPHHGIAANAETQLMYNVEQTGTNTFWADAVDTVIAANSATPELTILDELKERHEGFYLDPTTGSPLPMDFDNQVGDSGSLFIRLDNFQRTRDNMRQGVMDLMNLNATLGDIDLDGVANGPDLDVTDVKYVGHSLGAIVGTPFVALSNASLAGNTNLNQIQAAVLATPGGHMTKLIENSASLSAKFLPGLAAVNETLVQGLSPLESYMKVFQATLDSADPINYLSALKSVNAGLNTPILMVGMYGGADLTVTGEPDITSYLADLVVPVTGTGTVLANGTAKAPTAVNPSTGLQPFIDILGAENVTGTPAGNIYIAKYNEGSHGTFSSAGTRAVADTEGDIADYFDSADAYTEMLSQTVDLLDDGALTAAKTATVLIAD
jgi:pimeloyl-ACP methyl ester carboxylesterase